MKIVQKRMYGPAIPALRAPQAQPPLAVLQRHAVDEVAAVQLLEDDARDSAQEHSDDADTHHLPDFPVGEEVLPQRSSENSAMAPPARLEEK